MYGKAAADHPHRIVCLTREHVEICRALGVGERVVGAPDSVRHRDDTRDRERAGGVSVFSLDRILALEPDVVLAFSEGQADVVRDLVRAGRTVLCTNQGSVTEILQTILLVGGLLGRTEEARALVLDIRDEIRQVREYSSIWPHRPRVYFEEWPDPPVAGTRWVSEAVEVAGGRDIFPELRERPAARDRVVDPAEVARRDPQIILASWSGTPADVVAICGRPGWREVSAVRDKQIFALDDGEILSPGPALLGGLRQVHEIVQRWMDREDGC